MRTLYFVLGLSISLVACKEAEKKEDTPKKDSVATTTEKETPKEEEKKTETPKEEKKGTQSAKMQFVDFSFGDAEHNYFKDEKGKEFEFGRNEDKSINFFVELPKNEITSENQGFGANKKLLNKWFMIEYTTKRMPLYQDGPDGDVMVITKATPSDK
ncbi:hypothetical protein AD998_13665 [bacterium 336/3]|nr:hypothetical protein AD998_13665 [bacterium 336/3]